VHIAIICLLALIACSIVHHYTSRIMIVLASIILAFAFVFIRWETTGSGTGLENTAFESALLVVATKAPLGCFDGGILAYWAAHIAVHIGDCALLFCMNVTMFVCSGGWVDGWMLVVGVLLVAQRTME
jgi:hypothetical protein